MTEDNIETPQSDPQTRSWFENAKNKLLELRRKPEPPLQAKIDFNKLDEAVPQDPKIKEILSGYTPPKETPEKETIEESAIPEPVLVVESPPELITMERPGALQAKPVRKGLPRTQTAELPSKAKIRRERESELQTKPLGVKK